jgi:hypothetical protein
MTTPPAPNRWLAIAFAIAAAGCLAAAALTPYWVVNNNVYDKLHFGLRAMSHCGSAFGEGECDRSSNAAFIDHMRDFSAVAGRETSGAFAAMGWATFALCVLAALGLVIAAAIAIARKRPDLPMAPTTLALLSIMVALVTGCVFVATKPGPPGFVGVGLSFWLFGIGEVLGLAGSTLLAKVNRPPDPDLMEGAMDPDEF